MELQPVSASKLAIAIIFKISRAGHLENIFGNIFYPNYQHILYKPMRFFINITLKIIKVKYAIVHTSANKWHIMLMLRFSIVTSGVKIFSLLVLIKMESKMKQFKMMVSLMLAAVFVTMLGCASTPGKSGTGEYIDDTVITTKVKAAILNEETLKSAEINVETFKGVVQLSGFVNSEADIAKAASVARGVKGVTTVKNDMRLKAK